MKPRSIRPARVLSAVLACSLLVSSSCAVGNYLGNRGLDLTDVIDIKYGTSIGVGAKAELTYFLGAGAGVAALGVQREWYGRRSVKSKGFAFLHLGALGSDGGYGSANPDGWSDERADVYFLLVNSTAFADFDSAPGGDAHLDYIAQFGAPEPVYVEGEWPIVPPLFDRWRFGAEVVLPGGTFGVYLNLGELADFVVGLLSFDPAGDDGIPKSALYLVPPKAGASAPEPSTVAEDQA